MKNDICSIENCEKKVKSGKICEIHNWRFRKYKSYDLPVRSQICKIVDCEKSKDKAQSSAYCAMHRVRRSRHKSINLPEKKILPNGILKICIHHGRLTKEDCYIVPNTTWLNCKICKKEKSEKFKQKNPNRIITKNYFHFGKKTPKFRILIAEYNELHKKQNGLCKICNKPETMKSANAKSIKRLAIDHCHKSEKIRGLLCHYCNVSLGGFKDSIEILESAIEYLKLHS